jgi:hypothetical protein
MLRDEGKRFPGNLQLFDVAAKRDQWKLDLNAEVDDTPEYTELLDRNGEVIYGLVRGEPRELRTKKRRIVPSALDEFLAESESKDATLDSMFAEVRDEVVIPATPERPEVVRLVESARAVLVHYKNAEYTTEVRERLEADLVPFEGIQ